jgi:hypothetical protein
MGEGWWAGHDYLVHCAYCPIPQLSCSAPTTFVQHFDRSTSVVNTSSLLYSHYSRQLHVRHKAQKNALVALTIR